MLSFCRGWLRAFPLENFTEFFVRREEVGERKLSSICTISYGLEFFWGKKKRNKVDACFVHQMRWRPPWFFKLFLFFFFFLPILSPSITQKFDKNLTKNQNQWECSYVKEREKVRENECNCKHPLGTVFEKRNLLCGFVRWSSAAIFFQNYFLQNLTNKFNEWECSNIDRTK